MVGTTFIRVSFEGQIYDLDVLEQTPIRLDISSIENDRIGDVFGSSSQTFTLPSSRTNNRFFKHAYKVGVEGIPGFGNSVDCWVISDSDTLLEGSLFLDEILKLEDGSYNYNVTVTNNVISFNETVKTVAVRDLDWDDYDHTLNPTNIIDSWQGNLFGGDVFYPLVDFGTDGIEPTGSVPLVDILDSATAGYFDFNGTPLQVQQFSPAVRVSTILDKIFDYGGFTWSSSLQPTFDELYVLPRQTETLGVQGAGFGDYGFIAGASIQTITENSTNETVAFSSEIYDPTNSYNPTTYEYTVPRAGSYVIQTSVQFAFSSALVNNGTITIAIKNATTGNTYASQVGYYGGTYGSIQTISVSTPDAEGSYLYFNVGDKIKVSIDYITSGGDPNINIIPFSRFQTLLTPINYELGTVKLGQQFDPQTKCIDLLKGLIEKLNLVIEPVYTQNKVLKIETFDTWILSGKQYDWSDKLDNAKRISIKSPLSSQQKTLIFEDNKDNDKWSKIVQDNAEGYQWGTEVVNATSNVPQGERKIGSYFSPVVLEGMDNSPSNVIPKLYKFEKDVNKTFKHKPRLGYKVYPIDLGATGYLGTAAVPFTQYGTISNYNELPVTASSTLNLHFNESFYPPLFTNTPAITAYESYWNNYINTLYSTGSIILSADFEFEPSEIRDIALNNRLFVNDNWYRINKIQGYNLNQPDVATVELISLGASYQLVSGSCEFDYTVVDTTTTTTTTSTSTSTTSTSTSTTTSTSTSTSTSTTTSTTTEPTTTTTSTTTEPTTTTTSTTTEPTTTTTTSTSTTSTTTAPTTTSTSTSTTTGPTTTTTTSTTTDVNKLFELTINNNTDITYLGGFNLNVLCDLSNTQPVYIGAVNACGSMTYNIPAGTHYTSSIATFPCSNLSVIDNIKSYFSFNSSSAVPTHEFTASLYFDNSLTASNSGNFGGTCATSDGLVSVSNFNSNLFVSYSLVIDIN